MSSSRSASAATCLCVAEEGVLFQPCAVWTGTWCSALADLRDGEPLTPVRATDAVRADG